MARLHEVKKILLQKELIMNLLWFALVLIVYPLFGLSIYYIRNRLAKTSNFSYAVLAPAVISFVLGIGMLIYALTTM